MMATSAASPASHSGLSSASSTPPSNPSASLTSSTSAAAVTSPAPPDIINTTSSLQPAPKPGWYKIRRVIASNITAFLLTLLGLVTGVIFFILSYLPAISGLNLSKKAYEIGMWKDCRDRPDMHDTEVCKPYLEMDLTSIAKRGLNVTISTIGSLLWKSASASGAVTAVTSQVPHLQEPLGIGYMLLRLVAILLLVNSPWTGRLISTAPQFLRLDYHFIAFCANMIVFLGLESLLVQQYPNRAVRTTTKTVSWLIIGHSFQTILQHGNAVITSYASSHQGEQYICFVPKALARAFAGGGAIIGCVLWIVPYHQLPQFWDIFPNMRTILNLYLWFGGAVIVGGSCAMVWFLAGTASDDKIAGYRDPDVESGTMSTIKNVPATIFYIVWEVLLGMYRAVRGRKTGMKHPPSVYREKTE